MFKICLVALDHNEYETLNYAFNEVIKEDGDKAVCIQNFWGIYAALYVKGEPYRSIAERKRIAADIPPMDNDILLEAYTYHTMDANFEIAEVLYGLMHRDSGAKN